MGIIKRLSSAWNAFMNKDPTVTYKDLGPAYSVNPSRPRMIRGSEKSMINAVLTRIALDCSLQKVQHIRVNENGGFKEIINSDLNECFTTEANIDQTGNALLLEAVLSMLDDGYVAIVPTETSFDPTKSESYKIYSMRVGRILNWYPYHVKLSVYNQDKGKREEITLPKSVVAIIPNPLYSIMNEPNSTLQRLIRKLALLDVVDEQSGSGKLDLIIQLPYTIRNEMKEKQAEMRRKSIETQIKDSPLGIAYLDGTEKITQLSKPLENNLLKQVEYLQNLLYSQLGITVEILNGTANSGAMNNYLNRVVEPIMTSIADEMKRKFLTKTARSQGQSIMYFRDPFKLMPIENLAENADKLIRNEIMSPNEFREKLGLKPSDDPKSDMLSNPNMPIDKQFGGNQNEGEYIENFDSEDDLDETDATLDAIEDYIDSDMRHYASPYYDPVKAHEYYMQNRKLKGRQKTSSSEEDIEPSKYQEAATYVKKRINNEKSDVVRRINTAEQNLNNSKTKNLKSKAESLQNFLKQMSPEQRRKEVDRIKDMIKDLRIESKIERRRIQKDYDKRREDVNSKYSDKYNEELKKLKAEFGGGSSSGSGGKITRYKKRSGVRM